MPSIYHTLHLPRKQPMSILIAVSMVILTAIIIVSIYIFVIKPKLRKTDAESFVSLANAATFYDDAEARYNKIRNQYFDQLNAENVIESNPWIFIEETSKKPSGYPIESLGRLTDSNPTLLEPKPRSYYEFDEITYIGLPLPY